MNTDFRVAVGLFAHPKFVRLRRRLGTGGALAFVTLLGFTAQYRSDGSLEGLDAEALAIAAQYDGDSAELLAALVELRFLDGAGTDDDPYRIHGWLEHNPWAAGARERSQLAREAANRRWHSRGAPDTAPSAVPSGAAPAACECRVAAAAGPPVHAAGMRAACAPHCSSPPPSLPIHPHPPHQAEGVWGVGTSSTEPPNDSQSNKHPTDQVRRTLGRSPSASEFIRSATPAASHGDPGDRPKSPWAWLDQVPAALREHAARFEAFYRAYPRKEGAHEAWTAWQTLAPSWTPEMERQITDGLRTYAACAQWQDETKVPHPATWLRGRRWEGTPAKARAGGGGVCFEDIPVPAVPTRYRRFIC